MRKNICSIRAYPTGNKELHRGASKTEELLGFLGGFEKEFEVWKPSCLYCSWKDVDLLCYPLKIEDLIDWAFPGPS